MKGHAHKIAAVLFLIAGGISGSPAQSSAAKDAPQQEFRPDVPDSILAPAGEEVVLYAHATGWQVYGCQASADGKLSWALKAPEAELHDRKDKLIGQHSAGPAWKLKDRSEVTGKVAAHVDSPDQDSIPWLLLNAVSHSGNGALANVTTIQRVRTQGGQPPAAGCDEAHLNSETKSSYSADYYFYAPGN